MVRVVESAIKCLGRPSVRAGHPVQLGTQPTAAQQIRVLYDVEVRGLESLTRHFHRPEIKIAATRRGAETLVT